ncbi:MAG: tetratricopeptide repeat protein [Candidatus Acidiferrales bacterium]
MTPTEILELVKQYGILGLELLFVLYSFKKLPKKWRRWNKVSEGRWAKVGKYAIAPVWISIVLYFAISISFAGFRQYEWAGASRPFKPGKIGILFAEVPGDQDGKIRIAYESAIIEELNASPDLEGVVEIQFLEQPLPDELGEEGVEAQKLCEKLRAAFVLRPHAIEDSEQPRLTVCNQRLFSTPDATLPQFRSELLQDSKSLRLPFEIVALAEAVIARTYFEKGDFPKAAAKFKNVIESQDFQQLKPWQADIYFAYGNSLLRSGDTRNALGSFKQASELDPNSPLFRNNLGAAMDMQGRSQDAIEEYTKVIQSSPSPPDFVLGIVHFNLAEDYSLAGEYEKAIPEFNEALREGVNNVSLHDDLCADLVNARGDMEEALRQCHEAISMASNDPIPHNNLGGVLKATHQNDAALAEFQRAVSLDPGYAEAYHNECLIYGEEQQFEMAIQECKKALSLKKDFPDARVTLSHVLADSCKKYLDSHNPSLATPRCQQSIELNPSLNEAYFYLANALTLQNKGREAINVLERAKRSNPVDTEILTNLCALQLSYNNVAEGRVNCEEALRIDPKNEIARQNLARIEATRANRNN